MDTVFGEKAGWLLRTCVGVVVISLLRFPCALTLSTGAPIAACDQMIPAGHLTDAQTSDPPFYISVQSTFLVPGGSTRITLGGVDGGTFKGFLAIGKDIGGRVVGEFVDFSDYGQGVACDDKSNSGATHINSSEKDVVELEWKAPFEEGSYVLQVTFVHNFTTFWVSVPSEEIVVSWEAEPSASTLTSIPSTTTSSPPEEELSEIYDGCGVTKGCFWFPPPCLETTNCSVIASFAKNGDQIRMVLQGKPGFGATAPFIALGLSDDNSMVNFERGTDHVLSCRLDASSGAVVVGEYYNLAGVRGNAAVVREEELILYPEGAMIDGHLKCSFGLPYNYQVEELGASFELESELYYLLLASGSTSGKDSLAYHDVGRIASLTSISLSDFGGDDSTSSPPVSTVSTTEIGTSSEIPGEEVLEIYKGCGDTKGCYGFPEGCIDSQDCSVVTSYAKSSENIVFELMGQRNPEASAPFAAVGISDDASMAATHVIACRFDPRNGSVIVGEYCNKEDRTNVAVKREKELIESVEASMIDGFVKCSFHLPSFYTVDILEQRYDLEAVPYFLLLAAGSSSGEETLAYHDVGKDASPEKILLSSKEAVTQGPTTTLAPPGGALKEVYRGCGSTKGCFGFPNGCVFTENCVVVTSYGKLDEMIFMELLGSGGSGASPYAAVGLSADAAMGTDHVVGCRLDPGDNSIKFGEFYNDGTPKNIAVNRSEQLILNPSAEMVDGYIICRFGLPLNYSVEEIDTTFDLGNKAYRVLLAAGTTSGIGGLNFHDVGKEMSSTDVLLSSTTIQKVKSLVLIKVHGTLMIFAWLFCASGGMFLARYYKHTMMQFTIFGQALWFMFHRICMSLTLLLTISAFVVIFVEIKGLTKGSGFAAKAHPILGIILTALALLQVAGALFRPHPGDKNRKYFNWFHWTVGNTSYVIGIVCIYLANSLTKTNLARDYNYWLTLTGFVVYHVILHLILTIHTYIVDSKSQDEIGKINRSLVPGPMKSLKVDEDIKGTRIRLILLVLYFSGAVVAAVLLSYFIHSAIE